MSARSAFLSILPTLVAGSSGTMTSRSGHLNRATSAFVMAARTSSRGERGAGRQDGVDADPLAELGVGHGDGGDLGDLRELVDEILHLLRADLLPAAVDHVLVPPLDDEVAVGPAADDVAAAVPAVGREGARVLLRRPVVPARRIRAPGEQ